MDKELVPEPFKMIVRDYRFDGSFLVEFIPEDKTLTTHVYAVTLPFDENPSPSEEEVVSRIAGGSPQDFWAYERESKKFDDTFRRSLIGKEIESAHHLIPKNLLTF